MSNKFFGLIFEIYRWIEKQTYPETTSETSHPAAPAEQAAEER